MMKPMELICGLLVFGIILIVLGFTITFINMMIDHNCYQLEPNDNYSKTICEKYWNRK